MSEQSIDRAKAAGLCPMCGNVHCICEKEIEPLPPLQERLEQEKSERGERVERLSKMVEELFSGEDQEKVRLAILRSFDVPQRGNYHNEGMYMDTHLDRILSTIDDIYNGVFPKGIPEALKDVLLEVAKKNPKESFQKYAFLHDIDKPNTLKLKYNNQTEVDLSWEQWVAQLPPELAQQPDPVKMDAYLTQQGIEGVSYVHGKEAHGDKGAKTIVELGAKIDPSIIKAIQKHEAGFLFTKTQTRLYEEQFGHFSPDERLWAIAASYTDLMGSYQSKNPGSIPSKPEVFVLGHLMDSKRNFEIISSLRNSIADDQELTGWIEKGIVKQASIDQHVFTLIGKAEPLMLSTVLLIELKDKFAPKFIPGQKLGKFIPTLQKMFPDQFQKVRVALLNIREDAGMDGLQAVFETIQASEEQKKVITAWVKE